MKPKNIEFSPKKVSILKKGFCTYVRKKKLRREKMQVIFFTLRKNCDLGTSSISSYLRTVYALKSKLGRYEIHSESSNIVL